MIPELRALLTPAVMERVTLLLNHVLGREPAATARLQPHAGALIEVVPDRWPSLLPRPPEAVFRITPAGLLEWSDAGAVGAPGLRVVFDAANPAALALQLARGRVPTAHVEGDSRLAGDIDWLIANVRWDIADDLESTFGPTVSRALSSVGEAARGAFQMARQGTQDIAARWGRGPR